MSLEQNPRRQDFQDAVAQLRTTVDQINEWLKPGGDSHAFFERPSLAAQDADAAEGGLDRVNNCLGTHDLLLAAALDDATALIAWGEGTLAKKPTPVWAPFSVARTLIETCAPIPWLVATEITPLQRAARMLAFERQSYAGTFIDEEHTAQAVARITAEAAALGLKEESARTGSHYGEPTPSKMKMVDAIVDSEDFKTYELLSAGSHGELWAIQELGYEATEDGDGQTRLEKRLRAVYQLWAIVNARVALEAAFTASAGYRGWLNSATFVT